MSSLKEKKEITDFMYSEANNFITLKKLINDMNGYLGLEYLTQKGFLRKRIRSPEIGRIAYLFLKFFNDLSRGQLFILENQKKSYYSHLNYKQKEEFLNSINNKGIPVIIVCGKKPGKREIDLFEKHNIPLLYSLESPKDTYQKINRYLNFIFSPKITQNGVLMDVFGIGVLIKGKSGIGKSEVAIDLIDKRHRIVSDDLVIIHRNDDLLIGYSKFSPYSYNVETRGVGLINIRTLYGVKSIRYKKRVELIVELIESKEIDYSNFDRLRVEPLKETVLGIQIPKYLIPVTYSKNLANIIEMISLSHIAMIMGIDPVNTISEKTIRSKEKLMDGYFFITDDE